MIMPANAATAGTCLMPEMALNVAALKYTIKDLSINMMRPESQFYMNQL